MVRPMIFTAHHIRHVLRVPIRISDPSPINVYAGGGNMIFLGPQPLAPFPHNYPLRISFPWSQQGRREQWELLDKSFDTDRGRAISPSQSYYCPSPDVSPWWVWIEGGKRRHSLAASFGYGIFDRTINLNTLSGDIDPPITSHAATHLRRLCLFLDVTIWSPWDITIVPQRPWFLFRFGHYSWRHFSLARKCISFAPFWGQLLLKMLPVDLTWTVSPWPVTLCTVLLRPNAQRQDGMHSVGRS